MICNAPSLDLVEFVETNILPQYTQFDRAHNLEHVTRVIRNAMDLVRLTGADINMVYVIAAYHDLGMSGPRAVHHLTGGKILASDARLKRWFSAEQIKIMKEAVEDHRASASHSPRSLYGKIIAEADRDIVPEVVFQRTIEFGLANYPETSNNGSALLSTWTRSTPSTAISTSGFPARPTSDGSTNYGTSSPSRLCCASTSTDSTRNCDNKATSLLSPLSSLL